jgi:large subunit ribosomal protein L25
MKLSVSPRAATKKSEVKKLRREGQVPGVVYGLDQTNENVALPLDEFQSLLRKIRPGLLPTTVFELNDSKGARKALVKEIQYHPTTYSVLHVDFAAISDDRPVTVNVPIQVSGTADCVGLKLGGFLRQVIRFLKVRCLPKQIPQELVIDVQDLNIAQSKTLADLKLPAGVRPLAKMSEVVVVIGKRA